ncbi:MAG: hypothetical protein FJ295_12960 [Planctomycetes bacterium]|nr:hypothetical protein [Planctomycetota bacterium]
MSRFHGWHEFSRMSRARSNIQFLSQSLAKSPQPVYLLDDRRILQYCNPAFSEWTGLDAGLIQGARCDYHSGLDGNEVMRIAAGLCPPPEVFEVGALSGWIGFRRADGSSTRRLAHFVPLSGTADDASLLLAIVAPHDMELKSDSVASPVLPATNQLHARLRELRHALGAQYRLDHLVGDSPAAQRLRAQVSAAVQTGVPVTICGPVGAGREHVARTIHVARATSHGGIIPIDCGIVDGASLDAALEALQRSLPDAGQPPAVVSLLLLDLERLNSECQLQLLRRLATVGPEVSLLATAGRSPLEMARRGEFHLALASALAVIEVELPRLVDRQDDIRLLTQLLLEQQNSRGQRQMSGFVPEALSLLAAYPWPGELDELSQVVNESVANCAGSMVGVGDLPASIRAWGQAQHRMRPVARRMVYDDAVAELQRELIAAALARSRNNRAKAAKLLGLSRARLLRLIEQLGLDAPPLEGDPVIDVEVDSPGSPRDPHGPYATADPTLSRPKIDAPAAASESRPLFWEVDDGGEHG